MPYMLCNQRCYGVRRGIFRSGPGKPNQRKVSSWTFAGAFRNKSSMWIVLVFLRKNTRIHKKGRNSWTFRFGPFFGLVCWGDSWHLLQEGRGVTRRGGTCLWTSESALSWQFRIRILFKNSDNFWICLKSSEKFLGALPPLTSTPSTSLHIWALGVASLKCLATCLDTWATEGELPPAVLVPAATDLSGLKNANALNIKSFPSEASTVWHELVAKVGVWEVFFVTLKRFRPLSLQDKRTFFLRNQTWNSQFCNNHNFCFSSSKTRKKHVT